MAATRTQAKSRAPKRPRPKIEAQPGPQRTFLATPADIAVYGGSAGGGKSWALLLEPLRHVRNPHFGAVIFRRTSPQITHEGGLWDEAGKLYPLAGAKPLVGSLDWRFPSGANIGFRHLQHEDTKYDWDGSQVPLVCFDELIHFTESQFFYLLSRNRSTCGVRPYVRGTTNPEATSWVKTFLAPWVDKSYIDPAAAGEIRWFIRVDGKVVWCRSRAELVERYPDSLPKSCTFVRASVFDNQILLGKDPGYLANLKALPEVERRRLLEGDWDVKRDGLVYPGFSDCIAAPFEPPAGTACGGIDFGFHNPFCALAATLDHDDVLWVDHERYVTNATTRMHSAALLRRGGRWYADPAQPDAIAELRHGGHDVVPCLHLGPKPLLTGIDRVTERIQTGRLKVSAACAHLIGEANRYQYDPEKRAEEPLDRDNHALDALRYLITGLDRGRAVLGRPKALNVETNETPRLSPDNDEFFPELMD